MQVRGLLREPLLSGVSRVEAALTPLRQAFGALQREGALSVKGGESTLDYSIEVTEGLELVLRVSLEALLGGWAERAPIPSVALPAAAEAEARHAAACRYLTSRAVT